MRIVIQRVLEANVKVDEKIIGEINRGIVVFLGVSKQDTKEKAEYLRKKISTLRIFQDDKDKMNLSIKDINGELLIISQFTLYADCSNGNRPSFINAADFEFADELYEYFIKCCQSYNIKVEKGKFGADMKINLINDGPVTIILDK